MKKYIDIYYVGEATVKNQGERSELLATRVSSGTLILIEGLKEEDSEKFDYFRIYYPVIYKNRLAPIRKYVSLNVYPIDDLYIDIVCDGNCLPIVLFTGELADRIGSFIESRDADASIKRKDLCEEDIKIDEVDKHSKEAEDSDENIQIKFVNNVSVDSIDRIHSLIDGEVCDGKSILIDSFSYNSSIGFHINYPSDVYTYAWSTILNGEDANFYGRLIELQKSCVLSIISEADKCLSREIKEFLKKMKLYRFNVRTIEELNRIIEEKDDEIMNLKLRNDTLVGSLENYEATRTALSQAEEALREQAQEIRNLKQVIKDLNVLVDGSVSDYRLRCWTGKLGNTDAEEPITLSDNDMVVNSRLASLEDKVNKLEKTIRVLYG